MEETFEAGASVARVALRHGVNANQVFQWRRLHQDGRLGTPPVGAMKLLPVRIAGEEGLAKPDRDAAIPLCSGAIHIELPGEIRLSLEGSLDPDLVRAVLQSLRA